MGNLFVLKASVPAEGPPGGSVWGSGKKNPFHSCQRLPRVQSAASFGCPIFSTARLSTVWSWRCLAMVPQCPEEPGNSVPCPASRPISSSQELSSAPPISHIAGSAPPLTSRRVPPPRRTVRKLLCQGRSAVLEMHSGWQACAPPGAGSRMSASRKPHPAPPRARSALCAPCSVP